MKKIVIAIGSDHRGFEMKGYIIKHLTKFDTYAINWLDVGAYSSERTDYPVYAIEAIQAMIAGKASCAVLLCGTGIGMVIVANRFPGIYAGLAWSEVIARLAKEDDNCNVLALPSDYISNDQALHLIKVWLSAEFKGERYKERIDLIDTISI